MATLNFTEVTQNVRTVPPGGAITLAGGSDGTSITRERIEARIESVEYIVTTRTMALCFLTLDNGFVQSGESPSVDPAEFDRTRSMQLAYEDAFDKLWPYFGFMACEDRHREAIERQRAQQVRQVI
jgi:hypothetical protein